MTLYKIPKKSIATVTPDPPVPEALERFFRSGRHKLLVVDMHQMLCGILTPIDLLSRKEVVLET